MTTAVPAAEAVAFVAAHPHCYLTAVRADGWPTGYAMQAIAGDGHVDFSTYRASAKVRNILRDGQAGLVAWDPDGGTVLWAGGPVEVIEDARPAGRSDGPAGVPEGIVQTVAARHASGKRITLRLTITSARFGSTPARRP
jgi:hypothetical protein